MTTEPAATLAERAHPRERRRRSEALLEPDVRRRGGRRGRALIADASARGGKLLVFGNGGSAADATHIAAELVGRFLLERRALPALSLSDNASAVTAIGNDYGFERVFARQVEALGAPGDVALGISTSGRSANVLAGAGRGARARACATIGADRRRRRRAGATRSTSASSCPSDDDAAHPGGATPLVAHVLCELVERRRRLSAVFLDRDGVINRKAPEGEYVTSWDEFAFLPGALEGLRALAGAGVPRGRRRPTSAGSRAAA